MKFGVMNYLELWLIQEAAIRYTNCWLLGQLVKKNAISQSQGHFFNKSLNVAQTYPLINLV